MGCKQSMASSKLLYGVDLGQLFHATRSHLDFLFQQSIHTSIHKHVVSNIYCYASFLLITMLDMLLLVVTTLLSLKISSQATYTSFLPTVITLYGSVQNRLLQVRKDFLIQFEDMTMVNMPSF